ncbi:MAG: haloacid dehalogenase-like hydrolase [Bacteroidetes bacterium]|nr:haloacid dehalogenase-like hydrolase [Bacteroidota bacterium]
MGKLILFDIDGTLLSVPGTAQKMVQEALHLSLGPRFSLPYQSFSGRTDWEIFRDTLSEHHQNPDQPELWEKFCRIYTSLFHTQVTRSQVIVHPGGRELLKRVSETTGFFPFLLTGNIRETAFQKLRLADLDSFFHSGGFGDDHWIREELGPVAVSRAVRKFSTRFTPGDLVVIGDSPRDAAVARHLGAVCIGVTNGLHSADELSAAGCRFVVSCLQDAEPILFASSTN